ncbi:MAG TPA: methyltransferase domain-containing protein [Ktedonobacterales bacterium]|nr:methyltransferase domain-containing protein [Ktedonobacterales bacterium]
MQQWFRWLRRSPRIASKGAEAAEPTFVIGGRQRAAGVPYMLPTDTQEINRLDFQHYLLRYAFRGNYAAPIARPASILDVGTCTGRWAREMAVQFPAASVVGLDIVPPRADDERSTELRPANYRFVQGNVLEGLPFPDASFDFVHMRLMVLALPATRWPFVVRELVRVTRPGGWVESVEYGGERHGGPAITQLMRWGTQASALRGIDTAYSTQVGELLRVAGLHPVHTQEVDLPLGAYGGRVGVMNAVDLLTAMRALGSLYVTQGIATAQEFDWTMQTAQAEVESRQYQAISPFYIAFGQRVR